jgi:hypothetical protein
MWDGGRIGHGHLGFGKDTSAIAKILEQRLDLSRSLTILE